MNKKQLLVEFFIKAFLCSCFTSVLLQVLQAQEIDCTLKSPLILIHFGSGNVQDPNAYPPPNYSRVTGSCPEDGHYTFTSATSDCFYGDWFTLTEDHTPGDQAGNMMLVNASPEGGVFFSR